MEFDLIQEIEALGNSRFGKKLKIGSGSDACGESFRSLFLKVDEGIPQRIDHID